MAGTGVGPADLDDLERFTTTVLAGEFVFQAGEAGTDVFILQEGRIELSAADVGGVVVEAGGVFGEAGLFGSATRETSARALTDVRLVRLDRPAFDRVVSEAPQVAVSMLEQFTRRSAVEKAALRDALVRSASAPPVASAAQPAVERDAPSLVEVESGTNFSLDGLDEATVGRPDRAAGFVPEVDLMSLDQKRTLSRRHAKLAHREGQWFVREEAGTRNGTFVNGTRIATGKEVELHDGDQVQFGFVRMVFQWR